MSRISRYLRQHQPGPWLSFLILGTKCCNALLLIVGLAMFVYAGDLYLSQPNHPSPPSWPPTWPPELPALVFAGMGLLASLSACVAQVAASRHWLVLLNTHLVLLALLLAGQVCLAAAVAAYDSEDGRVVPDDEPHAGFAAAAVAVAADGAAMRRGLRQALMAYKWADAGALLVEVLTLVWGCLLHSAYMRVDERAEDLEEGLGDSTTPLLTSSRRNGQRPAPPGRTAVPPRVTRDDPWSVRMREQYGLDTSILSYNPQATVAAGSATSHAAAGNAAAAAVQPRPAGSRTIGCVVS